MQKEIFNNIRDLPYKLPISSNEPDHSCIGKHVRLKKEFEKLGVVCRFRVGFFHWDDVAIPEKVKKIDHAHETMHVYLECFLGGSWKTIDVTWDSGLSEVFQVNSWSENHDMNIAVPLHRSLDVDESKKIMSVLLSQDTNFEIRYKEFFIQLNQWFHSLRKMNV